MNADRQTQRIKMNVSVLSPRERVVVIYPGKREANDFGVILTLNAHRMEFPAMKGTGYWCSLAVLMAALLQGCQLESSGLSLPEGNPDAGKQVFVDLHCNGCHSISDVEYAQSDVPVMYMGKRTTGKIHVVLGGETARSRTQGELVTSVINPSHKISTSYERHLATMKSPMQTHNEAMTVQNLIDVVAFLQQEFD
jgi:hypothetical protein